MENKNAERVLGQPDQHTYYNAVQLSLPVNTLISLEKDGYYSPINKNK